MQHKVFISHASEDKDRFVLGFATKLREAGLDAWVDRWEIAPGDSVIKRIFDEGLGMADAVIVVVSRHSIQKPWVQAELDVAKVRQIEEKTRLIPIILDDCDIPMALRALRYERISNPDNYDKQLRSIIMVLHGMTDKPPLGAAPTYTEVPIPSIPNLPKAASLALKLCYDELLASYPHTGDTSVIVSQMEKSGIPHQEAIDALVILHNRSYIKGHWTLGVEVFHSFWYTSYGLQIYVSAIVPDYSSIVRNVIAEIVNSGTKDSSLIADKLGKPQLLILHIFESLAARKYVKFSRVISGMALIWEISPDLKYVLDDGGGSL